MFRHLVCSYSGSLPAGGTVGTESTRGFHQGDGSTCSGSNSLCKQGDNLPFVEVLCDGRHAGAGSGAAVLGVLAEGDAPLHAVPASNEVVSVARANERSSHDEEHQEWLLI